MPVAAEVFGNRPPLSDNFKWGLVGLTCWELRSKLTFLGGSVTTLVSGTGKGKGGVKSGACTESLELTDIIRKQINNTHRIKDFRCVTYLELLALKMASNFVKYSDSNVREIFALQNYFGWVHCCCSSRPDWKRNTPRVCVVVWWSKVPSHFFDSKPVLDMSVRVSFCATLSKEYNSERFENRKYSIICKNKMHL